MNRSDISKLIFDYKADKVEGYSKEETKETIRQALISLNGNSDKLTYKSFRRNPEFFDFIEEIIQRNVSDGLTNNEFITRFVDQRNIAEGDAASFTVKGNSNLIVADASRGTQGIRRQRINNEQSVVVTPTVHAIKLYEEMTRVMSGRIDTNEMLDAVSNAIIKARLDDVFSAWNSLTQSTLGADYYPTAGSYSEDALLDLCSHVSAANDGDKVMLVGTIKGIRKLTNAITSDEYKSDFYNFGYTLKWNGIDVLALPQRHVQGTNTFLFDDKKIFVIPINMDKPVKQVIGGDDILTVGEPTDNADLTIDVTLLSSWGTALVTGNKFGIYEMS